MLLTVLVREIRHAARVAAAALGVLVAFAAAATVASAHHSSALLGVEEVDGVQNIGGEDVLVTRHGDPLQDFTAGGARSAPSLLPGEADTPEARDIAASCSTINRTSDDTANATQPASAATIKVIYAYPTDVGNRLSTYGPVIQSGVKSITERIAYETGDTKSLRFDLGTSTGPNCVDVQTVALSGPSSVYLAVSYTHLTLPTNREV